MNDTECPGKKDDERKDVIVLSQANSDLLRHYLESPPAPNSVLKAAYERVINSSYLNEKGERIYEVDDMLLKPFKILNEDPE